MSRRSEWSIKAEEMYNAGYKLVDIAKALNKPEGTVRRCKATQDWDGKKKLPERSGNETTDKANARVTGKKGKEKSLQNNISENPTPEAAPDEPESGKSETNSTSRGGAPIGNKNAEGNRGGTGGPPGNEKALIHGGYQAIALPSITDEDELAILNTPLDKRTLQEIQIKKGLILESRMFKRLYAVDNTPGGMVIDSVIKDKGTLTTTRGIRSEDGELTPLDRETTEAEDKTHTIAEPAEKRSIKITEALARVMSTTQRGITQLHKIDVDDAKGNPNEDDVVNDWIAGVTDG